jgi:hypothetical protein
LIGTTPPSKALASMPSMIGMAKLLRAVARQVGFPVVSLRGGALLWVELDRLARERRRLELERSQL